MRFLILCLWFACADALDCRDSAAGCDQPSLTALHPARGWPLRRRTLIDNKPCREASPPLLDSRSRGTTPHSRNRDAARSSSIPLGHSAEVETRGTLEKRQQAPHKPNRNGQGEAAQTHSCPPVRDIKCQSPQSLKQAGSPATLTRRSLDTASPTIGAIAGVVSACVAGGACCFTVTSWCWQHNPQFKEALQRRFWSPEDNKRLESKPSGTPWHCHQGKSSWRLMGRSEPWSSLSKWPK